MQCARPLHEDPDPLKCASSHLALDQLHELQPIEGIAARLEERSAGRERKRGVDLRQGAPI